MSVGLAGGLAALTLLRFVILVSALAASEYGRLNIFLTFVNIAPALMSLGVSWQYQRIARYSGPGAARRLVAVGHRILLLTLLPTLVVSAAMGAPFVGDEALLPISIATVVISATTCLSILYSQIVLGLGYRSLASFMLFAVNGGVTLGLLPVLLTGNATILLVLGCWAIASLIAWGWSLGALFLVTRGHEPIRVDASLREGLLTIPALVGTFLLIFLARYLLGLYSDGATVASFSISSTITESAFLISVSLVGVYSNRVMDGEHPRRSLAIAIPTLVGLSLVGLATILWLLPRVAGSGYSVSTPVTLILIAVGMFRLVISAWKSRAVAQRRVQASAWSYVAVAAVMCGALVFLRSDDVIVYAIALTLAFGTIALYQWLTVRVRIQAETPAAGGPEAPPGAGWWRS